MTNAIESGDFARLLLKRRPAGVQYPALYRTSKD
jgi:hypothetical protein